jgi:hypothetical protein
LLPFGGLKRVPTANWFCLCGAIADAHNPTVSGIPGKMTTVVVGLHAHIRNAQAGYLYLFANDVERLYFNNRGGLPVEIRRVR